MRLIDADELIKILEEYANDKDSQAIYGEERLRLILGDCKIEIEKFPTAYDVDKVVERLEEMRLKREEQLRACVDNDMADYLRCKMSAIAEAIEIVKFGGIE